VSKPFFGSLECQCVFEVVEGNLNEFELVQSQFCVREGFSEEVVDNRRQGLLQSLAEFVEFRYQSFIDEEGLHRIVVFPRL